MIVRASAMRHAPTIFVKRGKRRKAGKKEKETGRTTQQGDLSLDVYSAFSTINNNLLINPISRM